MRKESLYVCKAFIKRERCRRKNSKTDGTTLFLFDNPIAWHNADGSITMTLAGHGTPTTRDRLNTLCWLLYQRRPFHQHKNEQYFDDTYISTRSELVWHNISTVSAAEFFKEAAE